MASAESTSSAKQRAVDQWTADPAGAVLASHAELGSAAFYREVERTRYELYPWLLSYLSSERWSGRRTLEIGVGLGTDHLMLRRAGADAVGIDLTPASVEHTRRRLAMAGLPADVRVADAERLPFQTGSFDAVYSFGVLHHTPDMTAALSEALRVLRPGGTAVIGVYNRRSYFHAWRLTRHFIRGDWRRQSLSEMRADFEHGSGTPLVILSRAAWLAQQFAGCASVSVNARHLPTNRAPAALRSRLDTWLRPVERRIGWYLMAEIVR